MSWFAGNYRRRPGPRRLSMERPQAQVVFPIGRLNLRGLLYEAKCARNPKVLPQILRPAGCHVGAALGRSNGSPWFY